MTNQGLLQPSIKERFSIKNFLNRILVSDKKITQTIMLKHEGIHNQNLRTKL